ncbi:hypothetical protein WT05_15700 [Burkholderia stagnalis]|nr:hypothetical protein WT05_15700 [Burkholderia stagnalis]
MSWLISKHLVDACFMVPASRDYGYLAEIPPEYPASARKRMIFCAPQYPRTSEERFEMYALASCFVGSNGQVDVAICNAIYQLVDAGIDNAYHHFRMQLPVAGDGIWYCRTRQNQRCAYTHDTGGAIADIACGLLCSLQMAEYGFCRWQEVSARRRKIHTACCAIE